MKNAFKRLGVNINNTFVNNFIKISTDAKSTLKLQPSIRTQHFQILGRQKQAWFNVQAKNIPLTKPSFGVINKLPGCWSSQGLVILFFLVFLKLNFCHEFKNCYLYITPKLLFKIQCCDRTQYWNPEPGWGPVSAREFHLDVSVNLGVAKFVASCFFF